MKNLKFRFGAVFAAAAMAAGTVIGAVALQDGGPATPDTAGGAAVTVDDTPIVYPGSFGLFPSAQ